MAHCSCKIRGPRERPEGGQEGYKREKEGGRAQDGWQDAREEISTLKQRPERNVPRWGLAHRDLNLKAGNPADSRQLVSQGRG